MICNVIDNRKRCYRWAKITAIIESTYHDNSCADSDQAPETINDVCYEERPEISLSEAVNWAQSLPYSVTLYLYDLGQGISSVKGEETEHFIFCGKRFESERSL